MRQDLHRLSVLLYVVLALSAAALRRFAKARRRRQFWRKMEGWL